MDRLVTNTKQSKLIFGLSLLTLLLVIIFWSIDIYKYAIVGAVFEMLWLFIIAAVFILPLIAIWGLFKNGFSLKSYYFLSILISAVSLIILFK